MKIKKDCGGYAVARFFERLRSEKCRISKKVKECFKSKFVARRMKAATQIRPNHSQCIARCHDKKIIRN
jgi:hypothetical protein